VHPANKSVVASSAASARTVKLIFEKSRVGFIVVIALLQLQLRHFFHEAAESQQ
jgi:hypothetical protein